MTRTGKGVLISAFVLGFAGLLTLSWIGPSVAFDAGVVPGGAAPPYGDPTGALAFLREHKEFIALGAGILALFLLARKQSGPTAAVLGVLIAMLVSMWLGWGADSLKAVWVPCVVAAAGIGVIKTSAGEGSEADRPAPRRS